MGWGRGVRGVRVTVPFYKSTVSACIILLISNVHQCHIILALIKYEIGHTLQKKLKFLFRIKLLYSYCHGIFFLVVFTFIIRLLNLFMKTITFSWFKLTEIFVYLVFHEFYPVCIAVELLNGVQSRTHFFPNFLQVVLGGSSAWEVSYGLSQSANVIMS